MRGNVGDVAVSVSQAEHRVHFDMRHSSGVEGKPTLQLQSASTSHPAQRPCEEVPSIRNKEPSPESCRQLGLQSDDSPGPR